MFERISRFFLVNTKLTLVIIFILLFFGMGAYILLPKQYNPTIVAPAFMIRVNTPIYSSMESYRLVGEPLEDALKEISGIDKVYTDSTDGHIAVMASFVVGLSQETAKTRLYDRLISRLDLRPLGAGDISIIAIDPEDLPQISYAIVRMGTGMSMIDTGRYLRSVALRIRDALRQVSGVSVMDVVGGFRGDVCVTLDSAKLDSLKLSLDTVLTTIRSQTTHTLVGTIHDPNDNTKTTLVVDTNNDSIESIGSIVLTGHDGNRVFLKDVASIGYGTTDLREYTRFASSGANMADAAFLGIAKMKGTNAVQIVDAVRACVASLRATLPSDIRIIPIQDEGETARSATNELLFHLFVSIGIVIVILVVFLGWRNALNAGFCIPLVLAIVFIVAFIMGLDINRITLFALILSLGILVDDSIVMVENNARHLAMMPRTGRTRMQALLDSVREVGSSVLFSTITRILSFVAMFAVTGMMGDYMGPIPVFASIALSASFFIALSINPFLAYYLHSDGHGHVEKKENKIITWYGQLLARYTGDDVHAKKHRRRMRMIFWVGLVTVIMVPILTNIFLVRMLPKANVDHAYLWVDVPRDRDAQYTEGIARIATDTILDHSTHLPSDLCIAENVSSTVGTPFLGDFANLFRGGSARAGENQLSIRINLLPKDQRTLSSEEYTIRLRPILRDALLTHYPDARIRLLEDPP